MQSGTGEVIVTLKSFVLDLYLCDARMYPELNHNISDDITLSAVPN